MKVLKKLLAISLVFIMSGLLVACGAKKEESDKSASSGKSGDSVASDPITGEAYPEQINIGVIEGGPESAVLVKENYFADFSVKVNVVNYSAGTDVNNAVVSKDIDVASFGASPIALGISNGIDYKAVFVSYLEGGNIEALVVKNSAGVDSVAGLKGKTIAAPFGTTSHYALLNALKLAGLAPSDVKILDMGGDDIVAAWSRGDIDAAYIWSPAQDEILKDGKILTNDGELAKQGITIPEIAVARTEFAKKYPTLVGEYVTALKKVYELVKNNPDQATKDVVDWEGTSEPNAKGQINDNIWISADDQLTADYLGTSKSKGKLAQTLKTISDFHTEQGNLTSTTKLSVIEEAIDPSYVETILKTK